MGGKQICKAKDVFPLKRNLLNICPSGIQISNLWVAAVNFMLFAGKTLMESMTTSLFNESFMKEHSLLLLRKLPHAITNHGKAYLGLQWDIVRI